MAKNNNLTDFLTSVADAIRAKKGTSDLINPQNFDREIASISTSKEEQEKTVTITENGTTEVLPDSGKVLSKVTVTANVPANVITKSITANGTYNAADDGVDGYSTVDVNVAGIEDISTSDEMTALLVEANVGKVYRFIGTTDETYTNGDLYEVTINAGEAGLKFRQYACVKPQLSTPQNVSADGTTVSWDEVENATSYAVLADGNEIGTVEKASGFVQIFPTKTSDNYTLFENLNQSKIYSIQSKNTYDTYRIFYLKYENGNWTLYEGNTEDISYFIRSQTDNSVKLVLQDGVSFETYSSGITLEGDSEATESDFNGLSPTQVYACWVCFVEGTKITLSDGSIKLVQDIQYGDKVLCYDFTNGTQTVSYIDWMIPERIATKYWEITLSDGTILNLVGSNGKSHRLYNITKQRFDYPQDFEPNDLTLKEYGTTAYISSCCEIEKEVRFYNIASHEHINVYANGVLTSNRLNNRFKIVDNKFTDEKVMTDKEVIDYLDYLNAIKAK